MAPRPTVAGTIPPLIDRQPPLESWIIGAGPEVVAASNKRPEHSTVRETLDAWASAMSHRGWSRETGCRRVTGSSLGFDDTITSVIEVPNDNERAHHLCLVTASVSGQVTRAVVSAATRFPAGSLVNPSLQFHPMTSPYRTHVVSLEPGEGSSARHAMSGCVHIYERVGGRVRATHMSFPYPPGCGFETKLYV